MQLWRDRTRAETATTVAPIAAVLTALASAVVATTGLSLNWRRQRRESTLRAWGECSDDTRKNRYELLRMLGRPALPEVIVVPLVDHSPLPPDGSQLNDDQRREVVLKMVTRAERPRATGGASGRRGVRP